MDLPNDSRPFLLEFFERALEERPALASMATGDGTMLHTACKRGASVDVIRALLNACPEAARTHNENGKLPLDYACMAENVSLESVRILLDHYPEALCLTSYTKIVPGETNKRVRRDRTPILRTLCDGDDGGAFEESKTELVLLLLERCPESASVMYCGYLPLHDACSSRAPIEIVQRLIEAYPQGVRERSFSTYDLPLHYACSFSGLGTTLEVVRLLVERYPESVRLPGDRGCLPIHMACYNRYTPLDVSQFVFNSCQDGARVQDDDGWLPLHYASIRGSSRIGRLLLEHYPFGARVQCKGGSIPLHFSCQGETIARLEGETSCLVAKAELARAMLRYYPDLIRTADNLGSLPLHWACHGDETDSASRWRTDFVRYLVELYPNAIRHADSKGQLPLHVFIASGRGLHHIRLRIRPKYCSLQDKRRKDTVATALSA